MSDEVLKRSFPPVVDERTRLLVLGSLPGEQSLAASRYYANPRNQFWRLMSQVIDRDLVILNYEERLRALLGAGVGLWDVIDSARRGGSLDASIRDHRANALGDLLDRLPAIKAVGFNGGTAARIGGAELAGRSGITLIPLPSSSPAFTQSVPEKLLRWRELRNFLI